MRRASFILLCLVLTACTAPDMPRHDPGRPSPLARQPLPPMKFFAATAATPPQRPNAEIARDFMDLVFRTEKETQLPILTRFKGPISLRVIGHVPSTLNHDLSMLLRRLRHEANVNIRRVNADNPANITIEIVARARFHKLSTEAACFVVPRVMNWADYRRKRGTNAVKWDNLQRRTQLAIFIPDGISPQELRDCLHEELAQSLGPVNDLYRLSDSVYNDDNFHSVLTGFDMLILRAYYAPELHNGMTRQQVAARLPAILARLNPGGQIRPKHAPVPQTPRIWIKEIKAALSPAGAFGHAARRQALARAVALARRYGLQDMRLGFSLYAYARLSLSEDPDAALTALREARAVFARLPQTQVALAHVAWQQATIALSDGDAETVIDLANKALPGAQNGQNAALLATLLMLKAEALEMVGRPSEARAVRLDSLGWARYGFGSDRDVRRQWTAIAALASHNKARGGR